MQGLQQGMEPTSCTTCYIPVLQPTSAMYLSCMEEWAERVATELHVVKTLEHSKPCATLITRSPKQNDSAIRDEMAHKRSLITAITIASLVLDATARFAPAYRIHQAHKHEARDLGKRQVGPPYMPAPRQALPTTTAEDVITYITPSPGATPIAVTEQSQIVTSFVPQYTLCELPPLAFFSASPVRPSTLPTTAPYRNYSISIPEGNGACTTVYKRTNTMVCATTLTGLFDKWTVTQCDQDLTFSTQYGYVCVTPTPAPASSVNTPSLATSTSTAAPEVESSILVLNDTVSSVLDETTAVLSSISLAPRQAPSIEASTITPCASIETLTTYYQARWQDLTAGTVPSDIDLKVCRTFPNGTEKCVREYESWHTTLVTSMTSTVTSVNISTTIHGLSQILVETYVANVTELLTTFSLSTRMKVGFLTEFAATHVTTREPTVTSTSPTVYQTLTVEAAA